MQEHDEQNSGTREDTLLPKEVVTAPEAMGNDDATASVEEPVASEPHMVDRVIDAWFGKVRLNTPLSRSTVALNYVTQQLPALKESLKKEIGE